MADEDQTPESSGEMSQEDIDAAIGGAGAENAPEPSDSAEMSQADIDAAIGGASAENAPEPSDSAEMSQADIDAALAGEAPTAEPEPVAEEAGVLSQADIDAALAGAGGDEGDQSAPEVVETRVDSDGRPFDETAAAMAAAIEEEKAAAAAAAAAAPPPPETSAVALQDFTGEAGEEGDDGSGIGLIQDVDLRVKIELGRTKMLVEDVLALAEGSVVELDKLAGDPVDVFVNDRLIARGEVLVLNDNFCVRISEIVSSADARQVG